VGKVGIVAGIRLSKSKYCIDKIDHSELEKGKAKLSKYMVEIKACQGPAAHVTERQPDPLRWH
jgi:hypothetical protein